VRTGFGAVFFQSATEHWMSGRSIGFRVRGSPVREGRRFPSLPGWLTFWARGETGENIKSATKAAAKSRTAVAARGLLSCMRPVFLARGFATHAVLSATTLWKESVRKNRAIVSSEDSREYRGYHRLPKLYALSRAKVYGGRHQPASNIKHCQRDAGAPCRGQHLPAESDGFFWTRNGCPITRMTISASIAVLTYDARLRRLVDRSAPCKP